jgi:conjugative relaxase-like TrwC/TraI family protein
MRRTSVRYYNDTARQAISASTDARRGGGLAEYYSESETREPVWVCAGDTETAAALVGLSPSERAGGTADMEAVARWLDDGIAPNGAHGRAFTDRSAHGFDLTFSSPKSVSLVRALGDDDVAAKAVEQAHNYAVGEALEYLHQHAGYTRVHNPDTGHKDLVRLPGLVMAAYQHETSREGDPHLHTHVLLPNRQARADGVLVSVDSKSLHHEAKAAGIIYQATLRHQLVELAGLEFGPVDPHTGMADIAGVERATIDAWSKRHSELRAWATEHLTLDEGSQPSAAQLSAAQKATRPIKPEHLSWAQLQQLWATDERGFHIDAAAQQKARQQGQAPFDLSQLARDAATDIDHAACTRADLIETIGARLPSSITDGPGVPPRFVIEGIADRIGIRISPPRLAHEREGHERFTTAAVIAEETAILDLMGSRSQRAALPQRALDTTGLSCEQARAVTAIATSPWLIQPLSAPAGAGKTTSLKALRAAAHRGGVDRVVVLAPTGKAVDVAVREAAGDTGYTVAKALTDLRSGALKLDARTLVVVDESGMVGTPALRELLTATTAAKVKTVLVGDAHQLAPVKARGGMFAQLCADLPWAQRLTEVWRLRDPSERTASLAVRDGGPAPRRRAVVWYTDHERLHAGDAVTMAHDALAAYQRDRDAGADAVLMTDTWEVCDALNTRLHHQNLAPDAPTIRAARGHQIGVGDVVITRRNDPTIAVHDAAERGKTAEPVRNGHRWTVYALDPDNHRVAARRIGDGARVWLGGDYLREHVHYGYAVTVHAAQGVTADTAHAVLSEQATRSLAYVALTRGRDTNHLYFYPPTTTEHDHHHEHDAVITDTDTSRTVQRAPCAQAGAALRTVLGRDDRARTMIDTAATLDRRQLAPEAAQVMTRHDRTRARLQSDYRNHHAATWPGYDLAVDLPALRVEITVTDTAGRAFCGAGAFPTSDIDTHHSGLDEAHRRAVTDIATSRQGVQPLTLYPGADKTGVLTALVDAAHHDRKRVLALPATDAARAHAQQHPYANTVATVDHARTHIKAGTWKLPFGSLVVVDDADYLTAGQLHWLSANAAATNTKLLLISTPDRQHTATHTVTAALDQMLPWAQRLGTPDTDHHHDRTATERVDHHLANTNVDIDKPAVRSAREILTRRDRLLEHFADLRDFFHQLDTIAEHDLSCSQDHGLEL